MRLIFIKVAFIAAILSSPWIACSQHYYVVVGAFAADEKASEFKGYLPSQVTDTSYTISEKENLLHFYVLKTSDRESAISKTLHLQQAVESWTTPANRVAPASPEGNVSVSGAPERIGSDLTAEGSSASASSGAVMASAGNAPPKPVGKYFKFKIESPEGQFLNAQVHHVDFQRGREVAAYNSDTFVDLLTPGESKPMAVVCGLFGYKEIEQYIDYANPSRTIEEAYVDPQGVWIIPYKLERVERGDVSTMYNVSFYKDAAVMRKTSQTDLDELVNMMHSNPYYEIVIHAHCNGKKKRDIIAPGSNRNYFDAAGSIHLTGTAKDLTAFRAESIRSYLVDHGIDPKRINVFSWGASDMLVRADSPEANVNDRIEIEFTRD
jgi:outer membrane protein OmpA-like peptidoglycan-associated protein